METMNDENETLREELLQVVLEALRDKESDLLTPYKDDDSSREIFEDILGNAVKDLKFLTTSQLIMLQAEINLMRKVRNTYDDAEKKRNELATRYSKAIKDFEESGLKLFCGVGGLGFTLGGAIGLIVGILL